MGTSSNPGSNRALVITLSVTGAAVVIGTSVAAVYYARKRLVSQAKMIEAPKEAVNNKYGQVHSNPLFKAKENVKDNPLFVPFAMTKMAEKQHEESKEAPQVKPAATPGKPVGGIARSADHVHSPKDEQSEVKTSKPDIAKSTGTIAKPKRIFSDDPIDS